MATSLISCSYDQLTLEQLSDNELLKKQSSNQRTGLVVLALLILVVGMAFALESYLVAATSWAMIPAIDDYRKKRKAIRKQLQKRNLG